MLTVIPVFFMAAILTAAGTPWVRRLALRSNFVDTPSARKFHVAPIPLLGGVAIVGGAAISLLLIMGEADFTNRVQGMLLALPVVVLLGLIDDRYGLPASAKLLGQSAAVAILVWFDVRVQLPIPESLNYLLTFVWVLVICNAVNFLDNMDGLCVGVCTIAAGFIMLIATLNGQILVAVLSASISGACLGFLRYNFPPATIFMGDAGSLFLGFILAILALLLRFPGATREVSWMVPIFVLGVPLFDLCLVLISRVRRGVNPFTTAGKDHLSHRLVGMGISARNAVLLVYMVACVFGLAGWLVVEMNTLAAYALAAAAMLCSGVALWRLEWQVGATKTAPEQTP